MGLVGSDWKVGLLFEIGVDALNHTVGIDRDLQNPELLSETACKIEADLRVEVVDFFDGQQPAAGAVADEEPLEVLVDTTLAYKGVADRDIADDCFGCEQGQRPFDIKGIGRRDEGLDELLHGAELLRHR